MTNKLETHHYDGKLEERFEPYYELFKIHVEHDDKIKSYQIIKKSITDPYALRAINLIINDVNGNYDSTNRVKADIILYYICQKIKELGSDDSVNIFIKLVELQLADIIISGSCAQGRCIRLAQIFFILYE